MSAQTASPPPGALPRVARPRALAMALLVGNFVVGLSILAPAGMIEPLSRDLGVSIVAAGALITGGAVVLCLGSPLVAWATATIDRRILLSASLAALFVSHVVSALAGDYAILFGVRLVAMVFAAIFTPQAAGAIAMVTPERERPGAISFIFLGWSLAAAIGLPLVAWAAAQFGWRSIHAVLAVVAGLGALSVHATMPSGIRSAALSFASWGSLLRSRLVVALLAATAIASAGQFTVFTYFGPLLARTAGADATGIAVCFAIFGVAGLVGNIAATRIVGRLGAWSTSMIFFASMLAGAAIWTLGAASLPVAGFGAAVWGLGFAASNSMQQARLATAAPALSGAAIALNSSSIYIGQAAGSATGAVMFERGLYVGMGWTAVAFLLATVLVVTMSKRLPGLDRDRVIR